MLIVQQGQLKQFNPRPGTPNQEAYTIVQVVVPTAQFTDPDQIADGYRYVGHRVRLTLQADPLPAAMSAERPMEKLWSSNGQEHTRPGPTESCSECGRVIGEDPDADFYAPTAGPPRPVCGDCKQAIEDAGIAEESDEQLGEGPMPERPADAAPVTTPIRRGRARAESAS